MVPKLEKAKGRDDLAPTKLTLLKAPAPSDVHELDCRFV